MDQYLKDYTSSNYLKGRRHYDCHGHKGLTCHEVKELNMKPCKGCGYNYSRKMTLKGHGTYSNPIAYYYLRMNKNPDPPEYLIVDEAHKLRDLAMLLTGVRFRKSQYNYPESTDLEVVATWLRDLYSKLDQLLEVCKKQGNVERVRQILKDQEKIGNTLTDIAEYPHNYVIYHEKGTYRGSEEEYLNVSPIKPPVHILNTILDCKKLILMSATLPEAEVKALARDKTYKRTALPSPIPVENRLIYHDPIADVTNWRTNPADIVDWIKKWQAKYPDANTIVHVTYGLSERLKTFFPKALRNTKDDKMEVCERFKKEGGLWLASGCAEGIDLLGDYCRLVLIPILHKPNTKDPVVDKRLKGPNGWLEYDLETLMTTIQQAGRAVRGVDDRAVTVVGDSRFPRLINQRYSHVPKSFYEAIKWGVR